ncbi:hypothetical protein [Tsukamurella ocularis]|uniref:hypothetical protein n=1 Tax=Tsukamurella ocularis TaxID=1970234 RepID=UPI002169E273|nr:hypothetical protein [Tsukamurella ocularis]MCS3778949.1 hypothetical protein [Tsukamurella ocularis]MCS3787431.1 hypothetical protein [Tsukamurella ocularis]MCS3851632.1 hypothetical protein [Tsukamurella ocularis]
MRLARDAATAFRADFLTSGTPDLVATKDLISLPYPTRYGLFRGSFVPTPFLSITNRMLIIRWTDSDGATRTLLFEPSDHELDSYTPYFAELERYTPSVARRLYVTEHNDVLTACREAGIAPEEVDYLAFDHLHTQDVRRWLGTTRPQADISPETPVPAAFPNARLLAQRVELDAMADLHPFQRPWYQPRTFVDLPPEKILALDGSVVLGPGVGLIATPGHAVGNQSLVLNTDTGIWAVSENAIATECLTPDASRIPGLARSARSWGHEVIINGNTLETTFEQYNSVVIEKTLVDRSQRDSRFLQFFPSSELTANVMNPGTSPTFTHRRITHRSS